MTTCEKHDWVFKGNRKFVKISIGKNGSIMDVTIRAYHVCSVCGKESKRTPNPNFPMPTL